MKRLLIEGGLPFEAIDAASGPEKTAPPLGHPFKMHRWWARRPLAMCRAIVLGSLVPDPGDDVNRREVFNAISAASRFKEVSPARVEPLRELIRKAFPDRRPKVLDCFAGGGAIPLEALRLGCDTTAIDLNPVACLLERCILEFPQLFGTPNAHGRNSLAADVERWGEWVRERARDLVADIYPPSKNGAQPLVWFWARTMPCVNPACALDLPLVTTWWLARDRHHVWLEPHASEGVVGLSLQSGEGEPSVAPVMKASSATCPICGTTASAATVRAWAKVNNFGFRLLAVLEERDGGRHYRLPSQTDLVGASVAVRCLEGVDDLDDGTPAIPDEQLNPAQYRKFGMLPYGISRFRDLFTPRQLAAAVALCTATREAHAAMLSEGMEPARARAAAAYLGLLVDRSVDNNSAFSTWENKGEKIRNTFARQSLAMTWDFTEIAPFSDGSGGWRNSMESVVRAIERCAETGVSPATVRRGNAQSLNDITDGGFDAVVVDPPYYDAVQYADLSDFFYVWLKRSVGHLYPELLSAPLTPKAQEVIENRADKKSAAYISSDEFERRLASSIAEMRRVVRPDGVVTIVFAHTDSDAWERLLRGLLQTGLVVSTSWPMESEKRGRSTANLSAVLGSSVVLVCRPRTEARAGFYDAVVRELDTRIAERLDEFEDLGLTGADYLISAIGPAFEVFGKYSSVQRLDGERVSVGELLTLARRTVARHAMRRLLGSEALASVDDITLLYLTWRWAYGALKIPVDEAQKLGKAFNIEVDELGGIDGLAETSRESYSLRGPDERKRIPLGPVPSMVDVLHLACQLHDSGRRRELADILASSGFAEETAFWAAARAIAESLPDRNRERMMLVNLLGGREQVVAAARDAQPSEALRLFDEASR
jgi:putative DNA methylase